MSTRMRGATAAAATLLLVAGLGTSQQLPAAAGTASIAIDAGAVALTPSSATQTS